MAPRLRDVEISVTFKVKPDDSRARAQHLEALRRGVGGKARHVIGALKEDPSTSTAAIIRRRR